MGKKIDDRKPAVRKKLHTTKTDKEKAHHKFGRTMLTQLKSESTRQINKEKKEKQQKLIQEDILFLLNPAELCFDLGIKNQTEQKALYKACEKFNVINLKKLEKIIFNALLKLGITDLEHVSIKEFSKAVLADYKFFDSREDIQAAIIKNAFLLPLMIFPKEQVNVLADQLAANIFNLDKELRVQALLAIIQAISDQAVLKRWIKEILEKDPKGEYRDHLFPEVEKQLKKSNNAADSDKLSTIKALWRPEKLLSEDPSSMNTDSVKNIQTIHVTNVDEREALQVLVKNETVKTTIPVVDKTKPLYQFLDSLQKEHGVGQLYARAHAQYNKSWKSWFRGNDKINSTRIKQLQEIQQLVLTIQSRFVFLSENEQKLAAETIYWKLFEIRDQANNDKNKHLQSIPLERVCQRLMDALFSKALKPNRNFQEALDNNPMLSSVYVNKPHTSFLNAVRTTVRAKRD